MIRSITLIAALVILMVLGGCARLEDVGQAPDLTTPTGGNEVFAMAAMELPEVRREADEHEGASLWTSGRRSLLGDRRAGRRGDILTVVIEIDDSAEIMNSTERTRRGTEEMGITGLFGLPQWADTELPEGATLEGAVDAEGRGQFEGDGSVRRTEELTLRVAATITDVLDNGVLRIEGSQEVRVNFEVRELLVSGYVRPEDISRQNEIAYDRIAAARISYGGRGQITDVQQPRWGQQLADILLPF